MRKLEECLNRVTICRDGIKRLLTEINDNFLTYSLEIDGEYKPLGPVGRKFLEQEFLDGEFED